MAGFDAETAAFYAAARSLQNITSDGQTDLQRLSGLVTDLTGGSWGGAAASRFQGGYDTWLTAAQQGLEALELMANLLNASGRSYEYSEDASRGTIQPILGEL